MFTCTYDGTINIFKNKQTTHKQNEKYDNQPMNKHTKEKRQMEKHTNEERDKCRKTCSNFQKSRLGVMRCTLNGTNCH